MTPSIIRSSRMAALLLLCSLPMAAPAATPSVAELYGQAIAAYRAGDADAMQAAAAAALAQRPGSPTYSYLLAAAEAMGGKDDAALARLEYLADQGLSMNPAAEPAFASLAELPQFNKVSERLQANGEAQGQASVAARLPDGHFVPEGLAWDPATQQLYIGSVHQRQILRVDPAGNSETFANAEDGLLSVLGMHIAADGQRLLVATAGFPQTGGLDEEWQGRTGILAFSLQDGRRLAAWWWPEDGRQHGFGDLLEGPDGSLYATDSLSGAVVGLNPASGTWRVIVDAGKLVSPQGLVWYRGALLVADYRTGIWRVDPASGAMTALPYEGTTTHGIDGMYLSGEKLLAIQNGQRPHRVVAFNLENADGAAPVIGSHQVLLAAHPEFDEPTLGTLRGDELLLVANSHWPAFDAEGKLPEEALSGPLVLAVKLEGEAAPE